MPDYPTEDELARVRAWPIDDPRGWLEYCRSLWAYPDYWPEDDLAHASTGGWSGNEEIIGAMQDAHFGILWHMVWEQTRRGGHYTFDLTRAK